MGATGACSLLARCGSDDADAGTDVQGDSVLLPEVDAQPVDAGVVCNEASQGTRWAGWSRVTEADPCCTVEVPDQVDASVEPLTWIPCTNDAGGCQEMPIDWGVQQNWTRFNYARVVAAAGVPQYTIVGRRLDTDTGEEDVYDFTSGTSLAAWREYASLDTPWGFNVTPASSQTWVYMDGAWDLRKLASAPTAAAMHPVTPFYSVPSTEIAQNAMQDFSASDTTLAFDIEPAGRIGRVSASAPSNFVFSDGGSGLINPLVHGDDVFAKSNYGNAGWAEEYVIGVDGAATVFRTRPNTQVDNFACDGANLYWTEGYGGAVGDDNQPTQEVWGALYTSDPTTLTTTAKKIADITGGTVIYAVAFNGYYAVSRAYNGATVVRASDGAKQQMLAGPDRQYGTLAYVSATELWAVMANGAGNVGGIAFQRQTLAPWP